MSHAVFRSRTYPVPMSGTPPVPFAKGLSAVAIQGQRHKELGQEALLVAERWGGGIRSWDGLYGR